MAELNFGLLTPPGSQSIGNAFVTGMDRGREARARDLQMQQSTRKGQMDELTYKKALDTESRLNKYYADIAANGGPKTALEAENAMIGSGIPHIADMGVKAQLLRLTNESDLALFNAANPKPGAPAAAATAVAPMAPAVVPEPGSFGADVAERKAADPFATAPDTRTNRLDGAAPAAAPANNLLAAVSGAARPTISEEVAAIEDQIDRNIRLGTPRAKALVESLQTKLAALIKTTATGGSLFDSRGKVIATAPAAPSPTARMQAELDALPPNDPRRPALQAEVNKALTAEKQAAERMKIQWGTLNVAQRNATTNEARLDLQRNAPKLGLVDPEDIDRVAVAVASGRVQVDRLNSTTAPMFAKLLKANPDLDFTKLSIGQAGDKTSAISNARIAARQTLTDVDATQAENIARGNLPPATGPNAGKIMNEVLKLNPDYNSRDFGLQTAAEKEFNIGKNGNKTRSLNVAVSHLGTLEIAAAALNAGDIRVFNQFKQAWQRETGKSAPTNFNAVRELVADEIVAAVVPGVGALADRKALKDTIMAKSSPAQLQGVIKKYKELLGGQLGGLEQQYKASTRKTDFRQRYLTPEAIAALTPGQKAPPSAAMNIPQAAINDLKAGRGTPEQFDEQFGAGAAARVTENK